jgi:hypothetical protein
MFVICSDVLADHLIVHLASVKCIPQWFPGAGFRRYAVQVQALHRVMRDRPVEVTQAQMVRCPTSLVNSVSLPHANQSMVF